MYRPQADDEVEEVDCAGEVQAQLGPLHHIPETQGAGGGILSQAYYTGKHSCNAGKKKSCHTAFCSVKYLASIVYCLLFTVSSRGPHSLKCHGNIKFGIFLRVGTIPHTFYQTLQF